MFTESCFHFPMQIDTAPNQSQLLFVLFITSTALSGLQLLM